MTDTLKAGDTVWTVEHLCIKDCASIPIHVCQQTVMIAEVYGSKGLVKLANGVLYNIEYSNNIYLTEDEALKALREERKQFLIDYPNDWQKIIEELQRLLEEQDQ